MNHAITCGVNSLNSFIYLWCNTKTVTIGRKVRFHHTLPFMTKQRCCSAAATSRLHPKFGVIDASVATSDKLTWHQTWCSQIYVWCFVEKSDVDWVVVFVFHNSSHFRTKISYRLFIVFKFLSSSSHQNVCLVIVLNLRRSLRCVETNILRKLWTTSPFKGDISLCFGFNEGTRSLLIEAFHSGAGK